MNIFGVSRRYRLGYDFADKLADDNGNVSSCIVGQVAYNFKQISNDEFRLIPKIRSHRPAWALQRVRNEWIITCRLNEMIIITFGFIVILGIRLTVCGSFNLHHILLMLLLVLCWIATLLNCFQIHKRFAKICEMQGKLGSNISNKL